MNDASGRNRLSKLPVQVRLQVDRLCNDFSAAWRVGHEPQIEDYLEQVERRHRSVLLEELLPVEIELRGEEVRPQQYQERFPDDAAAVDAAIYQAQHDTLKLTSSNRRDTSEAEAARRPPPETIGRYRVQRVLGAGGFGVVYLADDPELHRQVAIKGVMSGAFGPAPVGTTVVIDRVKREAQLAASLQHAAIVTIYDVLIPELTEGGNSSEVDLYIVQEYVEGQDLKSLLESGPLAAETAAELMVEIAEAVGAAHKRLVHRDLKPANILLDRDGRPHVADFGLAVDETLQQRLQGEVAGTPAYMAPEQTRGETHLLDGRADVWSLGVMLYEMVAGRLPFVAATRDELFNKICNDQPRCLARADVEIPAELTRICLKCLSKRMSDRYASCSTICGTCVPASLRLRARPEWCPRACGPLTLTITTSSSTCSPGRETATACPTPFDFGRAASIPWSRRAPSRSACYTARVAPANHRSSKPDCCQEWASMSFR